MEKPYRVALGLWIEPDFSGVLPSMESAPRVNHSKINFDLLREFFLELFDNPENINIRVANDTIDQVTIHFRLDPESQPTIRCEDFGEKMLLCSKTQKDNILNVRTDWLKLHYLKDRNFAPPPTILPFILEADNFEDAMIWLAGTNPALGLPVWSFFDKPNEKRDGGKLPEKFRKRLGEIFGCQFLEFALLDRMAMDKPPCYLNLERIG